MKPYNRAKQTRLNLISVTNHTINAAYDSRVPAIGKNKRRSLLHDPDDDGDRRHYAGRGGSENWSSSIQHQQSDTREKSSESRVPLKDRGEHRFGNRIEDAFKKAKDAA